MLFGTGLGSAYYMFFASRTGDARTIAHVVRRVVIADWLFTTTTIVFQPLSGLWLAHLAQIPLTSRWIVWSFVLFFVAGACWLPVVAIQMRMRRLAETAAARGAPLPPAYARYLRIWTALGFPAFIALVVVFYLMVAKPSEAEILTGPRQDLRGYERCLPGSEQDSRPCPNRSKEPRSPRTAPPAGWRC